jgi:hypothetical protein
VTVEMLEKLPLLTSSLPLPFAVIHKVCVIVSKLEKLPLLMSSLPLPFAAMRAGVCDCGQP